MVPPSIASSTSSTAPSAAVSRRLPSTPVAASSAHPLQAQRELRARGDGAARVGGLAPGDGHPVDDG